MLDFTIIFDGSNTTFTKILQGFITMTNKLTTVRFWAIWAIFFMLSLGVSVALVLWAYSLI